MIFVTGGTGLIGAHLLFDLVSAGKRVKALKRETSKVQQALKIFSYYVENPENLFRQIEWVNGDILDYVGLEKLLQDVQEVYHCAAIISFSTGERRKIIRNNSVGTANMVNAALENGVKKFCHVSSVASLGRDPNGSLTDEHTNWSPSRKASGYAESKFFSEMEVWRGIEEGLDAVIVNPSIVLGPGNWNTGSPLLFKTIWNGLNFYTKGITGYVDVTDVVRAMILLMDNANFETCKNQRFLLNAENISYRDLFIQIAAVLNGPPPKYFASNMSLELAWRMNALYGFFSGKSPNITRETASAANTINKFDGRKISGVIDFEYLPIAQSIQQTALFFLNDFGKKRNKKSS